MTFETLSNISSDILTIFGFKLKLLFVDCDIEATILSSEYMCNPKFYKKAQKLLEDSISNGFTRVLSRSVSGIELYKFVSGKVTVTFKPMFNYQIKVETGVQYEEYVNIGVILEIKGLPIGRLCGSVKTFSNSPTFLWKNTSLSVLAVKKDNLESFRTALKGPFLISVKNFKSTSSMQ
jgi:hypothetical protein